MRLNAKRVGRSDRAHVGFHRVGDLLEELAGLAPTKNLRSDCFVPGHERHGRHSLALMAAVIRHLQAGLREGLRQR